MTGWSNWSGGVVADTAVVVRPTSEDEVAAVVSAAAAAGQVVRPVGAGHSFTPLGATDGVIIDTAALSGVLEIDSGRGRATVAAGTRIAELGALLHPAGLALHNQGDVDVQAIGGAVATGTHGTGPGLGNLSSAVVGARLVTATGDVVDCSADAHPELFQAARLSLGALGVVTRLQLALVPSYRLRERTWVEATETTLDRMDERVDATRHYEFFWVPGRDVTFNKSLHPTGAEAAPVPLRRADGSRERVEASWRLFPTVRDERFEELEFAVPAEAGPTCLRELRDLMGRRHPDVTWPLEYRTVAADDVWLSPAQGRATVTISVHQGVGLPHQALFADAEAVFRAHDGRPHWGKHHRATAEDLGAWLPGHADFVTTRRLWDPQGRFLNDHLRPLVA